MTHPTHPAAEIRSLSTLVLPAGTGWLTPEPEVRMVERDGKRVITGYGARFNAPSQVLRTDKGDPFIETIRPGAFRKAIEEADVRGLFNHNPNFLLGRRASGTLRLREDDAGLAYEIDAPDTSYARDLAVSLDRRDVSGSSFSFAVVDDEWSEREDGMLLRELRAVHLFDVGPVVFPAYRATSATVRSLDGYFERRDAGRVTVSVPAAIETEPEATPEPEPAPAVTYPTPAQVALLNQIRLAELA